MKNKGAAIILVAGITLCFLLLFAVLAIDFSRMYYVRGELQNAADAAALAGAAKLDGTTSTTQTLARQEAWKFACKNRAAQAPVYLVTNASTDCDSPPDGPNDLNQENDPDGDIIVGHWTTTIPPPSGHAGHDCMQAGSGCFCRAKNGSTGLTINALKARPRRTSAGSSYGMGPVTLLFGKLISGLTNMGVVREAIASLTPLQIVPFPVCIPSCSLITPLKTEWGYDPTNDKDSKLYHDPEKCSDPYLDITNDDSITASEHPGQQFFLNSSFELPAPFRQPGLGWTNFATQECSVKKNCDTPNSGEVAPYITGKAQPPNLCNKNICTTNGNITPLLDIVQDQLNKHMSTYNLNGQNIKGWLVSVPVVSDGSCGETTKPCPGDPHGKPYTILRYTKAIITEVITTGKHGIRFVGLNNAVQKELEFQCYDKKLKLLVPKKIHRWVSQLDCVDCNTPPGGTHAQLVK